MFHHKTVNNLGHIIQTTKGGIVKGIKKKKKTSPE